MTGGVRSSPRVEWRGDLFRSELERLSEGLCAFPVLRRRFTHTVTVFVQDVRSPVLDVRGGLRIRAYVDLDEISEHVVERLLAQPLRGKLQGKCGGQTAEAGDVLLRPAQDGRSRPAFAHGGTTYVAWSVRVARRVHRAFGPQLGIAVAGERHRVTVDEERHLFRISEDGRVRFLGELGPRIEVKAPSRAEVLAAVRAVDPNGVLKHVPNRSLALLLADAARDRVRHPKPRAFPEIELKLAATRAAKLDPAAIERWLQTAGAELLAPFPHRIERMRRYHVCVGGSGEECTVVETASGRMSAKRKRDARLVGTVLVRDTEASLTTDATGAMTTLDEFLRVRGWTCVNAFTKLQTKIPFALPNGDAFLVTLDRCRDRVGTPLRQVELEYIGTSSLATRDVEEIAAELDALAQRLLAAECGFGLAPTAGSKHAFFRRAAETAG